MRRLTLLPLLILPLLAAAQEERPAWSLPIEEVPVVTRRTMKEIGVQRTQLDSTVLHDNISLSMADVLTQNANLFIKSYGRATLATAEFRGTSPSHTQVTWNGMRINSPMLGTVDFSMIPAFFIDAATLLHGASSIGVTGGALGGAVVLGTRPSAQRGWQTQYVQGVGSFSTFDQYLRVSYGGQRWSASTRAVYSTSDNDFRYTNYDKMELVYGPDGAVVDTYHPVERNRSGYFRDLHLLQELYYNRGDGTRYGLSAWYLRSKRGLPFLSTDYRDDVTILNEQREQTLRAVASWERLRERLKLGAKLGYAYTASAYDFRQRNAQGAQSDLTLSRSYLHTPYGQFEAEYYVGRRWLFTGNVALHVPMVDCSDKSPYHEGDVYDRYRVELSGHLSAKWRPTERIGLAVNLRGELYDRHAVPLIPAFFFDWVVSERGNVVLKASVARNYRYPTLNDRYYQPGGNPDLRPEHGFTYDGGISFALGGEAEGYTLRGEATLFDSHIDDWILWVQARRGYWTPRNVRKVHNYGAETKVDASVRLSPDWRLGLDAHFAWTPSINYGEPVNDADASYGKQLVYVPEYAAAATATLGWRRWTLVYKWNYYSERYTTTSNDTSLRTGRLEPYYMSDLSLERSFALGRSVAQRGGAQPLQRRVRHRALAPHAPPQLRNLSGHPTQIPHPQTMRRLLPLLCGLLLAACGQRAARPIGDFTLPVYTPRYASGFEITGAAGSRSTLVTVHNPWYGDEVTDQYLFIARDGEPAPAGFEGQVLRDETRRVVCMSGSYIAMLDALGAADRVVGVSGAQYLINETLRRRIARGEAADVGFDSNVDFERLMALRPDLVMLFGIGGADTALTGKLRELGIPYLYMGEHCEESPLGKSEWVVVAAEIAGLRTEGSRLFAAIPERYERLRALAQQTAARPRVMLNTPYRDTWFMPARNSYMVRLLEDAGARYVFEENTATQTLPIDIEQAYYLTSKSDFWLNVSGCNTLDEVRRQNPRLADTPPVREGRVYDNNRRRNAAGGSDFWESGVLRPDRVLADLVHIFHPELSETDELYYYRQLE